MAEMMGKVLADFIHGLLLIVGFMALIVLVLSAVIVWLVVK